MSYLSIAFCCALLVPSLFQNDEKALLSVMKEAEIVVVAEVEEVGPSLGAWSGLLASVQHVKYRVVEVLKGKMKSNEIDAGHYVVHNSLTADKEKPHLSPELFKPGNRLILILSRERGHGCKLETPKKDMEAFCSPNENAGAILADSHLVDRIRAGLKGRQ
jgi:hypothetical protein